MYIPSIDYRLPNTVSFVCNTQLLLVGIDHIIPKHESAYWTIFGLYTMSIALGITFHMIFATIFTRKKIYCFSVPRQEVSVSSLL